MIDINGKVYRNLQEQVLENTKDIADLQNGGGITIDAYTKEESDAKFQTIAGMSDYATNNDLNTKQDKLTAGANITIDADNVISATGGGSGSYTAGTGIDITSDVISIDNTVALKTDIPATPTYSISNVVTDQGDVLGIQVSDSNATYNINNTTANPTLSGTETALSSIDIGGTYYKIESNSILTIIVLDSQIDMSQTHPIINFTQAQYNLINANNVIIIEFEDGTNRVYEKALEPDIALLNYWYNSADSEVEFTKIYVNSLSYEGEVFTETFTNGGSGPSTNNYISYNIKKLESTPTSSAPSFRVTLYITSDLTRIGWSSIYDAIPVGDTIASGIWYDGTNTYNVEGIYKQYTGAAIIIYGHQNTTNNIDINKKNFAINSTATGITTAKHN